MRPENDNDNDNEHAQVLIAATAPPPLSPPLASPSPPSSPPLSAPASRSHARRPAFHVSSASGFCSDPAGPLLWRGWHHLFLQCQPRTCQWHWGLGWAHAASRDLALWVRLPDALAPGGPGPGALDGAGCFSGTAAVEHAGPWRGVPALVYTGVFLRSDGEAARRHGGVDPPHGAAPLTRFVESQMAAVPAAAATAAAAMAAGKEAGAWEDQDPLLVRWQKLPDPVARWPPSPAEAGLAAEGEGEGGGGGGQGGGGGRPARKLACWRDPWLVGGGGTKGGEGGGGDRAPPTLLLCSGTVDRATDRAVGGAVLAFSAPDGLTRPWRCLGLAADAGAGAASSDDGKDAGKKGCVLPGRDWEMPRVAWVPLREGAATTAADGAAAAAPPQKGGGLHALVLSPDSCDQPPVYALGGWDAGRARFDLKRAAGPYALDLGRTFYAATVWEQPAAAAAAAAAAGRDGSGGRGGGWGAAGRTLLWGWLQEHRPEVVPPPALTTEFDHAGCLSLPRVLTLVRAHRGGGDGDDDEARGEGEGGSKEGGGAALDPRAFRVFQEPLPELIRLRSPVARWSAPPGTMLVPGAAPLRVGVLLGGAEKGGGGEAPAAPAFAAAAPALAAAAVIRGTHLDIEAELELCSGNNNISLTNNNACASPAPPAVVALALRSWRPDGAGAGVLAYDWRASSLEFAFDDPQPTAYDARPFLPVDHVAAARRRVGGCVARLGPGEPLRLRVLVDGSAVEVFTGGGEVLSTRVYRGEPPPPPPQPFFSSSSEEDEAVAAAAAVSAAVLEKGTKSACACACGVEVFASGAPVRVRRLEAWEVLPACLDPLLAGRGGDDSGPSPVDIARAAIAALDAAEQEAARLGELAAAAPRREEAGAPPLVKAAPPPLSPPPPPPPSSPAQAPSTPELSPAFLAALDLTDAAREEGARRAAEAIVDALGGRQEQPQTHPPLPQTPQTPPPPPPEEQQQQ